MELEEVRVCPVCGATHFAPYRKTEWWQLLRCTGCALVLESPRPTWASVVAMFSEQPEYLDRPEDQATKRQLIAAQAGRVYNISRFKPVPGRLVDVGCGSGFFLACAQERGWEAWGTEISTAAVAYARGALDLKVETGGLATLPAASFDAATMYHTLEHVDDPVVVLREIHRVLRADGLLVIEVPNLASFDAWWKGEKWEGWAWPTHLFHFTPHTLTTTLLAGGFRRPKIECFVSHALWRVLPFLKQRLPMPILRWSGALLPGTAMAAYTFKSS